MPLTISEANKYSTNQVLVGVAEEIVRASPLLEFLPFVTVLGNAAQYLRENTIGAGTFFDPGDTWTESVPTTTQVTTALKILGGDADIDKFLRLTRSKDQDLQAEILTMRAKGVAHTFETYAIRGDSASEPKAFDGLRRLVTPTQSISLGTNGGPGSFTRLDELIDLCKPRPDALIMSHRSRRQMTKLARAQGWDFAMAPGPGDVGRFVALYNTIPILVSDFIPDNLTQGTATDTSEIYAVVFGEGGVQGLAAGGGADDELANIIQLEEVGTLETRDATRWRIKMYVALALRSTVGLARLFGITAADWTN